MYRKALQQCVRSWNDARQDLTGPRGDVGVIRTHHSRGRGVVHRSQLLLAADGPLRAKTCLISFIRGGNQRSAYRTLARPWALSDKPFPRPIPVLRTLAWQFETTSRVASASGVTNRSAGRLLGFRLTALCVPGLIAGVHRARASRLLLHRGPMRVPLSVAVT